MSNLQQEHDDELRRIPFPIGIIAMMVGPVMMVLLPFLVAGLPAVIDLLLFTALAIVTWFYFNPPSVIHDSWLRETGSSEPPVLAQLMRWLDSPVIAQGLLSAWPPMLGVFIGRELSPLWTRPVGALLLYAGGLGGFTAVAMLSRRQLADDDDSAPAPRVLLAAKTLLWLASIGSFLWMAATYGPYLPHYF